MNNNTPTNRKTTVLVVGATGITGRRVAQRLTAAGVPVRRGSRSSAVRFDWDDDSTWPAAVRGATAAYIVYYPYLSYPGAAETVGAFAQLAVANGVRRLVLLGGRGEDGTGRAYDAVQRSGVEWTIVQSSFYAQDFSEAFLVDAVRGGVIPFLGGDVGEPFIDADDVADVAVAALTDDRHAGRVYEVTGPRLLSFADAAGEIAKATGHHVEYVPLTSGEFAAAMESDGLSHELAHGLTDVFAHVLDGRNAHLTDIVQHVLGRQPRDFRDYAQETADTGIWTPA
jgi:uncharacterized protein YbjT (DUF2867 family)